MTIMKSPGFDEDDYESAENAKISGELFMCALKDLNGRATPSQIIHHIGSVHDEYDFEEIEEMVYEVLQAGLKTGFLKIEAGSMYITSMFYPNANQNDF